MSPSGPAGFDGVATRDPDEGSAGRGASRGRGRGGFLSSLLSSIFGPVLSCLSGCGGMQIKLRDRKFRVMSTLGEGGFSFVYLVRDTRSRKQFACKRILAQSEEQSRDVRWEVEVHREFDHPNILRLEDYAFARTPTGEEALLLFPACMGGTLHDRLMLNLDAGTRLGEEELLKIFRGTCVALQQFHAHSPPWAHRDIKPGNILLEGRRGDVPVLMDFGSTTQARVKIKTRSEGLRLQEDAARNSSMAYRAPELWDVPTDSSVDEKTDVWSMGCTLFAMSYGSGFSPFECQFDSSGQPQGTECSYLRVISKVPWPSPRPKTYSRGLEELILSMLKESAEERPTIDDVLSAVDERLLAAGRRGGAQELV